MPFVSTGSSGFGDFLGGLGDLARGVLPIVREFTGPRASVQPIERGPGGAFLPVTRAEFDLPGLQVPFSGTTLRSPFSTDVAALAGSPFRPTMAGAAAKIFFVPNPVSGKITWFGPLGRPILWSRDLTVCKRVKKVARRARRAGG